MVTQRILLYSITFRHTECAEDIKSLLVLKVNYISVFCSVISKSISNKLNTVLQIKLLKSSTAKKEQASLATTQAFVPKKVHNKPLKCDNKRLYEIFDGLSESKVLLVSLFLSWHDISMFYVWTVAKSSIFLGLHCAIILGVFPKHQILNLFKLYSMPVKYFK